MQSRPGVVRPVAADMTGLDVVQALRARRSANDWLAVILSAMSANDLREIEGDTKTSESRCASQAAHQPNLVDLIAK